MPIPLSIRTRVKTLFNGDAGIPEKYVEQSKSTGRPIMIFHDKGIMTIKSTEVTARMKHKSKMRFKDRYSKDLYYLCYFDWVPETEQGSLV